MSDFLLFFQSLLFQLQKENIMLVKELQLLKSGERIRGGGGGGGGGEGVYSEENLSRRQSRQSRRHSRLDEEGEEEVVKNWKRCAQPYIY